LGRKSKNQCLIKQLSTGILSVIEEEFEILFGMDIYFHGLSNKPESLARFMEAA